MVRYVFCNQEKSEKNINTYLRNTFEIFQITTNIQIPRDYIRQSNIQYLQSLIEHFCHATALGKWSRKISMLYDYFQISQQLPSVYLDCCKLGYRLARVTHLYCSKLATSRLWLSRISSGRSDDLLLPVSFLPDEPSIQIETILIFKLLGDYD